MAEVMCALHSPQNLTWRVAVAHCRDAETCREAQATSVLVVTLQPSGSVGLGKYTSALMPFQRGGLDLRNGSRKAQGQVCVVQSVPGAAAQRSGQSSPERWQGRPCKGTASWHSVQTHLSGIAGQSREDGVEVGLPCRGGPGGLPCLLGVSRQGEAPYVFCWFWSVLVPRVGLD